MNFTLDVKKEIMHKGLALTDDVAGENVAGISAYLKTSGNVGIKDGVPAYYFVSETEKVAEFFMQIFLETFGMELLVSHATMDKMSGRDKLVLQCPSDRTGEAVKRMKLVKRTGGIREGISASLVSTEGRTLAYIRGAFLGGGSCIVPSESGKTGYHLEFVFAERKTARDFCDLLLSMDVIAKVTERKETFVVYVKSKEIISDFLALIGVETSLKRFSLLVEKRDKANNVNRARNCIAGNADKSAIASVKQVVALKKLMQTAEYKELSAELKGTAKARVNNPSKSLQELAEHLGVSKSCLNHRLRKLMELAKEKDEETNGK